MIIRRAFLILILFLILVMSPLALKAEQAGPYLDFANSLFEQKDYYRAVTEAKRFLFLKPDDPRRAEAHLLMGRSYFQIRQYARAKKAFTAVIEQKERPDLKAEAIWELGRCIEILGPGSEAANYYRRLIDDPPYSDNEAAEFQNRARYKLGWLLLEQGRFVQSRQIFSSINPEHALGDSAARLSEAVLEGRELPLVSPTTAGILSAALPGAGQLYSHRPVDAALAFGLNAAFLWGTVEAYNGESWAVFTLLGLIETALYGGNIYNAVNGSHIHNKKLREDFVERLRRKHMLRLGYSRVSKGAYLSWALKY
ncbi:MAG: tetratricopeptide repeat protein [Deltaproteobacteria bacterium]|nr:tetratricopeptide repeat protein [Deltaproteobacteria bacterium]MBW2053709.1 tetratricopeptide repeat protein [Deltaproteobacteria bacterium]MBW2141528.1 tetratricopeptide repeat protein [Deltaproteobacteria bacterium]MBW2323859.1 tetratricopeptide repeat protein [Deltaproteobacteria bacterium]